MIRWYRSPTARVIYIKSNMIIIFISWFCVCSVWPSLFPVSVISPDMQWRLSFLSPGTISHTEQPLVIPGRYLYLKLVRFCWPVWDVGQAVTFHLALWERIDGGLRWCVDCRPLRLRTTELGSIVQLISVHVFSSSSSNHVKHFSAADLEKGFQEI